MRTAIMAALIACTTAAWADQAAGRRSLRVAVEDLIETFGDSYPRGREYLARLEKVDPRGFVDLQREALLANPLVSRQPLLFVVRAPDTTGTHLYMEPHTYRGRCGALKLRDVRPWYNTPWPLSDKYFLCARAPQRHRPGAPYLVDVFGNEVLLHSEGLGCYSPMPLAPRRRPIVIPSRRDFGNGEGVFFVQDVHQGTHMKGVKGGSVRAMRVVEVLSKRGRSEGAGWNGLGMQTPAMNWTEFNAKRILGTAPVAADGSAHFAVPSDRFVHFQLLDANDMMVQSMRSGTTIHSGQMLGCAGCHESRLTAPPSPSRPTRPWALRHAPASLRPWYGSPRRFSYIDEAQPTLDLARHGRRPTCPEEKPWQSCWPSW